MSNCAVDCITASDEAWDGETMPNRTTISSEARDRCELCRSMLLIPNFTNGMCYSHHTWFHEASPTND
jgi:hypothetical protein